MPSFLFSHGSSESTTSFSTRRGRASPPSSVGSASKALCFTASKTARISRRLIPSFCRSSGTAHITMVQVMPGRPAALSALIRFGRFALVKMRQHAPITVSPSFTRPISCWLADMVRCPCKKRDG